MEFINTDPRPNLISAACQFYHQGWMVGTAGNLSARLEDGSFWITASGKNKGELSEKDFVRISPQGELVESPSVENRPSAETSIHQVIYSLFPEARACYHVHSVAANVLSKLCQGNTLALPPIEMLKGLGIWEENPQVSMPIVENYAEVPRIAQAIKELFTQSRAELPALLIRHHGITVWAPSTNTARNYVEVAEYIFRYLLTAAQFL